MPSTGKGKGKGGSDGRSKKYHKQEIATMIASAIKEHDNKAARTAESDKADAEAYIMALIKKKGIKATISEVVGFTNTVKEVTDVVACKFDSTQGIDPTYYCATTV
jgi:hypothetical protein